MVCPNCASENVKIENEQVASKTKTNHTSFMTKLGRLLLIICTVGLWLLVPKKKETGKTKIQYKTVCICQNCAHKWDAPDPKQQQQTQISNK